MIIDSLVYLVAFSITSLLVYLFQRFYCNTKFRLLSNTSKSLNLFSYCIFGCLFLFPIIAMFGLRYGIGTDYFSYEEIYNVIHRASFFDYWILHNRGISYYYVEIAYYFINRIFPSYRLLLWGLGVVIFSLFLISVKDYSRELSFAFALYIFLCTQFIYSMNGTRFVVAVMLVLIGYNFLVKNKTVLFVICIVFAACFHKSCILCLAMYFLKNYKYKGINNVRNIILFVSILSFPVISGYLLGFLGNFSFFTRYFSSSVYSASESMGGGWTWVLHIVPVILPLFIFCRKEIFENDDTNFYFRICFMEIPFRMLGLYNTWYTRYARCSQIVQFIFVPLVLYRIKSKQKKIIMYSYYIIWFAIYFVYYAVINDNGDSLPYVWIFSHL